MEDRWSDIDLQRTRSHVSGFNTSVPLFVKIDQEMGLCSRVWTETDRRTDVRENDFIICTSFPCYSYGTDKKWAVIWAYLFT